MMLSIIFHNNSKVDLQALRKQLDIYIARRRVRSILGAFDEDHSPLSLRRFSLMCVQQMSRPATKPTMWLCDQRRLRSAWASAQSDQSLRCARNG